MNSIVETLHDALEAGRTNPQVLMQKCSDFGYTPLHTACDEFSNLEVIEALVDACPKALEETCVFGFTPIDLAMKQLGGSIEGERREAEVLAYLLDRFPGKHLTLKAGYMNCSLGPETSRTLGNSHTLTSLDLTRVHLSPEALVALFSRLETNTALLDLTVNFFEGINDTVCTALKTMLIRNTTLLRLTLRVRLFEDATRESIQSTLEVAMGVNETLQYLTLEMVPQIQLRLLMRQHNHAEAQFEVDRSRIDFFLGLNRGGRAKLRNPNATKREFFQTICAACSCDLTITYILLSMAPHLWAK
eukprot:CAMPEP_0116828230 /NCGR_PEP_ID=MMETSP0418-20121206/3542_1 /TAXON_ID=1158023 /ORGANISM="Astrosyne radiata, Strain 13vi08-1A" /LENGTH=302 /DNA_ID=CAMNT_0004457099 /DNA_START=1 /DNA_END=909 /DNA_ORIENTATION=+